MAHHDDLYRAALLYYIQGESMEAIARQLDVSRSTVSRHLKQARQSGLVRITLNPPDAASSRLESTIERLFGITAHIVTMRDSVSEVARLDRVSKVAASFISDAVVDNTMVGLAWGTTLAAVATHLVAHPVAGCTLVQLNGAANDRTTGIDYVSNIMSSFAHAFDADSILFPVPAFFDYASTREALWRERSIIRVRAAQEQCGLAVFSVGSLTSELPSHVYSSGYLTAHERAGLAADHVVGDVCTVLLRSDGSWADIELNARASGPTPNQLRRIPRRICVVAGSGKALPLLAALRAKVMTELIVDVQTANALLELL
ncbi:sugar-binding transcriptional regulator [Propionibacterium cyclohexanicum]|uniref:sugar-binding transcriptional regulator n=1 Tax=Propionibacterium cyclohexanicum TaxID=64702 RepID=UPI001FE1D9D9|nr:sugar-binding domain-containing protein [Propionibacterium cyclohexanicum]